MVSRVSAVGILTQNISTTTQTRSDLDALNFSLATGERFQNLKSYGSELARIIDLKKDIEAREAYLMSIEVTETTVESYDAILERLVEVASDALSAADPLSSADPDFQTITNTLSDNFMLEVEANLNLKLGDLFIFAGTNFQTAPVVDLRTLTVYSANDLASQNGTLNTIETGDEIPFHLINETLGTQTEESYHTSFAGGPAPVYNSAAYEDIKVTINDNQAATYNITATESAFQNLIEGLLRLKSAAQTGLTEAQRDEFLGEAISVLETARTEIRALQSTNGGVLNEMQNAREAHEGFIVISQNALGNITVADDAEVAVRISALQNRLEASFSVIATQSRLSLVNFLR